MKCFGARNDPLGVHKLGTLRNVANVFVDVERMRVAVVENERPVTAFTLNARFHRADSAYIHTVALSQSVR